MGASTGPNIPHSNAGKHLQKPKCISNWPRPWPGQWGSPAKDEAFLWWGLLCGDDRGGLRLEENLRCWMAWLLSVSASVSHSFNRAMTVLAWHGGRGGKQKLPQHFGNGKCSVSAMSLLSVTLLWLQRGESAWPCLLRKMALRSPALPPCPVWPLPRVKSITSDCFSPSWEAGQTPMGTVKQGLARESCWAQGGGRWQPGQQAGHG